MLVPNFFLFLRGYLVITINGNFPERFINVCAAKNILLWDIVKISDKCIRCKITVKGFKMLPPISRNTGVKIKINMKYGLPFSMHKYRKRKIFLSSILIFILFTVVINQFVWDIEIRGNEKVKTADILSALNDEGVKIGMPKARINQREIKNNILIKLDTLSWLWINKNGSKIIVDVRERIPTPEIFNPHDYTNIISAKDCVIDSLVVRNGIPVVSIGDAVLKDTVLVTGKIPTSSKPETRYLNADAQIYARVWYEETKEFSKISTVHTKTGKKKNCYTLKIFGKEIPLFHRNNTPFEHYEKDEKKYELSIGKNYLGITLYTYRYDEVVPSEEIYTDESVASIGAKELREKIENEVLPDSKIVSYEDTYEVIDETTVKVTVRAEYIEDVAVKVKGETPSYDDSLTEQ